LTVAIVGSRRALHVLWVVLATVGILLLAAGFEGDEVVGVLLALFAGTMWGIYILASARVGRAYPGLSGLSVAMGIAALLTLPVGIADAGSSLIDGHVLIAGFGIAILSSAIPYSVELEALRHLPAHVFGILMSLEPAIAALAGFVIIGQDLSAQQVVAIVFVAAASAGSSVSTRAPAMVPVD
jgi:inner membrane transporter RhtA